MKKIFFSAVCIILLTAARTSAPEDCFYCKWDSEFGDNDILIRSRLEERVSSEIQVVIENSGDCVWKKNEVYIKIKVVICPARTTSEANNTFKVNQKHYMETDNVEKGEDASFRIKFNAVPTGGQYNLEFTLMTKSGSPIGKPVRKYLLYK